MNKTLAYYIREYLSSYLITRRNCSKNTVWSYRDTLKLFLNYNIEYKNLDVKTLNLDILNYENVNQFLDYLEANRNISANSRNQRLACIKSLCKYIISYEPTYLEEYQKIIGIKSKKYNPKHIDIFTSDEIKELFKKPNIKTKKGLKDLVILTIFYDAALRINEVINLNAEDILLGQVSKIYVRNSKGNKSREVPITDDTAKLLQEYKKIFNIASGEIFIKSNQNKKYTPNGIRKIIKKYTKNSRFKPTSHTFRHTKACHLIDAKIPLIYIRDFLGHEHIETTEIYAKINSKLKDDTIKSNGISLNIKVKYNINEDEELLDWLNNL